MSSRHFTGAISYLSNWGQTCSRTPHSAKVLICTSHRENKSYLWSEDYESVLFDLNSLIFSYFKTIQSLLNQPVLTTYYILNRLKVRLHSVIILLFLNFSNHAGNTSKIINVYTRPFSKKKKTNKSNFGAVDQNQPNKIIVWGSREGDR